MDDIFLLFKDQSHAPLFLAYLNQQHRNMEFTCEFETNGLLPFLDVSVFRSGLQFCTSLYRKPTFSGVYTNFDSFSPDYYKFGLMYTLLCRAYNICSSFEFFHNEIVKIKSFLQKNGYPLPLIDVCVSKFLNKLFCASPVRSPTVPGKPVSLVIPYTGSLSLVVKNRVQILLRRLLPQVSGRIVLKPSLRLSIFFPFKDKIPHELRSLVVYKFSCSNCNITYVGKSKRHLKTRACEHAGLSDRTGIILKSPQDSAIFSHFSQGVCARPSLDDFSIVCSAKNDTELQVRESILISNLRPELNRNIWTQPLILLG